MTVVLAIAIFSGAFAAAFYAIAATVVPDASRILDALAGRSQAGFALVQAERRIAVNRWAAIPRATVSSLREAA